MRNLIICLTALSLASCAATPTKPAVTEDQVAAAINAEATGFQAALSSPAVIALIPSSNLPKVQAALQDLMAVDAAVIASPSSALTAASIASVEADVNVIVDALAPLSLPPPYSEYLAASAVLLPIIEAGLTLPLPPAPSPAPAPVAK